MLTLIDVISPAAGKQKKVKEDFTKKCVCKPANQQEVQKCYDCLKNYDVNAAEQVILPVRRCDPNYGIQGPLYRFPTVPGDDDDDSLGGKGVSQSETTLAAAPIIPAKARIPRPGTQRKNRKIKNVAPSGSSGVFTLVWWIGIQIVCVLGAIVFFVM